MQANYLAKPLKLKLIAIDSKSKSLLLNLKSSWCTEAKLHYIITILLYIFINLNVFVGGQLNS